MTPSFIVQYGLTEVPWTTLIDQEITFGDFESCILEGLKAEGIHAVRGGRGAYMNVGEE
jgi:hypothetical protein